MTLTIRRAARRDETSAIYRFRYAINKEELGALIPEHATSDRLLCDAFDAHALHYGVFDDDTVVGALRIFDLGDVADPRRLLLIHDLQATSGRFRPDEVCFAGRPALDPRYRSGTTLIKLMSLAFGDVVAREIRLVYADCSPYLLPLFEALGFRRCAEPFNDAVYGFKQPIVLLCATSVDDSGHGFF